MRYILIKYRLANGSPEEWHRDVERFIADIDGDAELHGRIGYRAMRAGEDYYHIAAVSDDAAAKLLNSREFFDRYTARIDEISGDTVEVIPLEVVAETQSS